MDLCGTIPALLADSSASVRIRAAWALGNLATSIYNSNCRAYEDRVPLDLISKLLASATLAAKDDKVFNTDQV
jgi:hypothetical protein